MANNLFSSDTSDLPTLNDWVLCDLNRMPEGQSSPNMEFKGPPAYLWNGQLSWKQGPLIAQLKTMIKEGYLVI